MWKKCEFTPGMIYYELDEWIARIPFNDKDKFNGVHVDEIWDDIRSFVWFLHRLNIIKSYDWETEIIYMRER